MTEPRTTPPPSLPAGWSAAPPTHLDVDALAALRRAHETVARGWPGSTPEDVGADVVGRGATTRQHLAVRDDAGAVRGWGTVHDRAAGRTLVSIVVDPALPDDDAAPVAASLLAWAAAEGARVGAERELPTTQLDSGVFAGDLRQRAWLAAAGYAHVRTWWQMSRPVTSSPSAGSQSAGPDEAEADDVPRPPRPGVVIRRVARGPDGLPDEGDLRAVHDVLEEAFDDHFNSHTETFDEFCSRLREDPGHRWDHWWIAELDDDPGSAPVPVGALVASASVPPDGGPGSSYVDYLGVLATARGRGAGGSLLDAVIGDAARRGRTAVGLEVDADSPTGADKVYLAKGFVTKYVTESWHLDVPSA